MGRTGPGTLESSNGNGNKNDVAVMEKVGSIEPRGYLDAENEEGIKDDGLRD